MMIIPVDAKIDKAQDVSHDAIAKGLQCRDVRPARRLDVKNHDRDQDGDNAVAKSFHPLFLHQIEFQECCAIAGLHSPWHLPGTAWFFQDESRVALIGCQR